MKAHEAILEAARSNPEQLGRWIVEAGVSAAVTAEIDACIANSPTEQSHLATATGELVVVDLWDGPECWVAELHDFPGALSCGATREEALVNLGEPLGSLERLGLV